MRLISLIPITTGQVHFIRKVESDSCIPILNHRWLVSDELINTGVWATIHFLTAQSHANLIIYDQPPDTLHRRHLARYRFPLSQSVVPLRSDFVTHSQPQIPSLSIRSILHLIRETFTM